MSDAPKDDWGFPRFAQDFPRHPDLDRLVEAFSRGDYATVRLGAPKLAASTDDDAVKKAAQTLRARIEPDPSSRLLFVFAALLLACLTGWWIAHDGPQGDAAPTKAPSKTQGIEQ